MVLLAAVFSNDIGTIHLIKAQGDFTLRTSGIFLSDCLWLFCYLRYRSTVMSWQDITVDRWYFVAH